MPASTLASTYTGVLPLYGGQSIYGERSQAFRTGRSGGSYLSQDSTPSGSADQYQTTSADQHAMEATPTDAENTATPPTDNQNMLPDSTESEQVYSSSPPRVAPHAQPDDETPPTKEAAQRGQEFMRGMGQGLRHMFSLPGLLTIGAAAVIGAVLPWAVPWMVLAGLGFGLFNVIAGMSSDNWEQAGQGAFSLISSVVLGTILSDLFPGNGRGGLNLNPFREANPLHFHDYCGDPFKGVNQWWSFPSANNTGLVGVSYNTPWTQWAVPLNSASAAEAPSSVSGMMTAMADVPVTTPSDMMLVSAAQTSPSTGIGGELIATAPSSGSALASLEFSANSTEDSSSSFSSSDSFSEPGGSSSSESDTAA